MKKLIALAAAVVGMATLSAAQDNNLNNISLRAGIAWPATADFSGTFIGAGLDYDFGKSWFGGSGTTFFSFDWLSKSTQGTRGNLFPIMINQKFWLQAGDVENSGPPIYGFIGGGLAIIDVSPASTVLAGRLGLGAQFNPNFFAEADFVITGRTRNTNVTGNHIGLYVGYKF